MPVHLTPSYVYNNLIDIVVKFKAIVGGIDRVTVPMWVIGST